MLKVNIGEGKETSNEEVEGGAQGKQIEDSCNAELDWVVNEGINIFQVEEDVTSWDLRPNLMSKRARIRMKLGVKIKHEEKIMWHKFEEKMHS